MSKSLNTLIASLLLAGSGSSFAASSIDLSVRGLITPSACAPSLGNGGQFDVGKIAAKDLKVNEYTLIDEMLTQLTVTCEGPTLMAIEPKDNRAGSQVTGDPLDFGLGLINGNEKLGAISTLVEYATADGVAGRAIDSADGGVTWGRHRSLSPGQLTSVANTTTYAPIPVQVFETRMSVTVLIAPASSLTLTEEVPIDGSITLTVRYL
ncbi:MULTISPECIES: DUF1120 domain-containing protein [Pseudomonas]|uniref:DUF1120 domain-containing protein n=1 Tax=Pseudomonas fluorescens LMG 5329 TaxID=1324332 RepID=A0A0A1YWU6_PSEFL|nr:DUF1120 domain-containing protein [Pseudomonas fluorescens]KGE65326.1 hypothetical protein K814_0124885 [Pseudomonas fluorescens LMG 5329]NWE00170.1 DUF1120 domain-containing protein [Pseudomonas sp. IPO3749]NWF18770.1 DUF1120 domain-containing protein [Pseudomonas sp. IPO3749]